MTTLLNAMQLRDVRFGLETMCVGGGKEWRSSWNVDVEVGTTVATSRVQAVPSPTSEPQRGRQVAAVVLSSGEDNAAKGTSASVCSPKTLSRTTG